MTRREKLAKLPRQEVRQRVWQELVSYANANDEAASQEGLKRAFFASQWELPIDVVLEEVRELVALKRPIEEALRFWAVKYRPDLQNLLTWLCLPNKRSELGQSAAQFLQANSSGIRWSIDKANDDFDETGENGAPIFLWPESLGCDSIMSPICRFIVERIWQFQEGELRLNEAIPIRICEREGCGKFMLPERKGRKRFCSDQCRAIAYLGSREDWNEYMRRYRKLKAQRKRKGTE